VFSTDVLSIVKSLLECHRDIPFAIELRGNEKRPDLSVERLSVEDGDRTQTSDSLSIAVPCFFLVEG
jgi:hypothetical protein